VRKLTIINEIKMTKRLLIILVLSKNKKS